MNESNYQVTISYADGSSKIVYYKLPEDVLERMVNSVSFGKFHKRGTDEHKLLLSIERYRI